MSSTEAADRFDFDDKAIRELVEHNHRPEEIWTNDGRLISLNCEQCGHTWPCAPIKRLREWYK